MEEGIDIAAEVQARLGALLFENCTLAAQLAQARAQIARLAQRATEDEPVPHWDDGQFVKPAVVPT